jgi:hypothetical protein
MGYLGAREFDTDVCGHRDMRAPAGEPAHLANERVAQIGMLTLSTVHDVTGPCSCVDVGIAGTEISLDLASDGRLRHAAILPRDPRSLVGATLHDGGRHARPSTTT